MPRKEYTDRSQKVLDFVLGFIGWFLINGLLYTGSIIVINKLPSGGSATDAITLLALAAPLLINIAALIYFGFARRWVALGALAAFALTLLGTLVLGALVYAICFSMGSF